MSRSSIPLPTPRRYPSQQPRYRSSRSQARKSGPKAVFSSRLALVLSPRGRRCTQTVIMSNPQIDQRLGDYLSFLGKESQKNIAKSIELKREWNENRVKELETDLRQKEEEIGSLQREVDDLEIWSRNPQELASKRRNLGRRQQEKYDLEREQIRAQWEKSRISTMEMSELLEARASSP